MCATWSRPELSASIAGVTVFPDVHRVHRPHWSSARTWLLLPGRQGFWRSTPSDADVVVLDIEDGLPDAEKPAGRQAVGEWLHSDGSAWVRISSAGTPDWQADLDAVAAAPGLSGVMLAK